MRPPNASRPHVALAGAATAVFLALVVGARGHHDQPAPGFANANANTSQQRLELRFQSELDNVTIAKHESQQQIFKCQVRLAASSSQQGTGASARLRAHSRPMTSAELAASSELGPTQSSARNAHAATNVTLAIDWLYNGHPIIGQAHFEPIKILNVELKSGAANTQASSGANASAGISPGSGGLTRSDKSKLKWRVEIKNTLNSQQLKLTSRLRLAHLRSADSGLYRCVGRVAFVAHSPPSGADNHSGGNWGAELVEQWLESQWASQLLVSAKQVGGSASGKQPDRRSGASGRLEAPDMQAAGEPQHQHQYQHSHQQRQPQLQPQLQREAHASGAHRRRQEASQIGSTAISDNASLSTGSLLAANHRQQPTGSEKTARDEMGARDSPSSGGSNEYDGPPSSLGPSAGPQPPLGSEDDEDSFRLASEQTAAERDEGALEFVSGSSTRARDISDNPDDEIPRARPSHADADVNMAKQAMSIGDRDTKYADSYHDAANSVARNHPRHGPPRPPSTSHDMDAFAGREPALGQSSHTNVHSGYLAAGSLVDSTRMNLVRLVHKIAPESSCYTGNGEHYRGAMSTGADNRPCLNWLRVRQAVLAHTSEGPRSSHPWINFAINFFLSNEGRSIGLEDDHNHCRNPNLDSRGPWCFVQYDEERDGGSLNQHSGPHQWRIQHRRNAINFPDQTNSDRLRNGNNNMLIDSNAETATTTTATAAATIFVPSPCAINPCSEYLWLYIVVPPLGLFFVLFCALTIVLRSIRRARHNRVLMSDKSRAALPKLAKLLSFGSSRVAAKRYGASGTKKVGRNYIDDDIFEVADDLDWSDANQQGTQSLSPKSTTESLKLNSSFSSGSDADSRSPLSAFKGVNPSFSSKLLGDAPVTRSTDLMGSNVLLPSSRSTTQTGPMFATLRCQLRKPLVASQLAKHNQVNKSSTFIEQADLLGVASQRHEDSYWLMGDGQCKSRGTSSSNSARVTNPDKPDTSPSLVDDVISPPSVLEEGVLAAELPRLNESTVSVSPDQEAIFEGKFSVVRRGYLKQPHPTQKSEQTGADLGAQVAIFSLKPNASASDQASFDPENLRLRNLNHLNLLKLIGHSSLLEDDSIGAALGKQSHCSLIYDMTRLVDLSDWIKQQSKDALTSSEPGNDLRVRRNLTCMAKQIALAIDYLHDQDIIYKDLACRNCFLDPGKMLIKLASFNVELVEGGTQKQTGDSTSSNLHNLRSMIRPKYLDDYYVIDSRPSDSQVLPLSWIPLESILFNKFNKQTDIWSFGCLLYELFSLGEVAYFGYSSKQVIDAVRSNLMPPQPLLCPNGIYKLMCKCLSDIPAIRPNIKQVYEQLNLYSGQCSSFLDHHLCSLATAMYDDQQATVSNTPRAIITSQNGSITKTKSYANMRTYVTPANTETNGVQQEASANLPPKIQASRPQGVAKIPLSRSINLTANRHQPHRDDNHYDEPILNLIVPSPSPNTHNN